MVGYEIYLANEGVGAYGRANHQAKVEIDEIQCGFMSGRGTTNAIFIVCQLQ